MSYAPAADRYERMSYRRSGLSGLQLPAISLGLWHNFGHDDRPLEVGRAILRRAFDPLRPRQQLRAAVRLRGGELRAGPELRKQAKAARAAADDIEDEYHRADDAVATLEGIKRNLDEFNESAHDLLKDK